MNLFDFAVCGIVGLSSILGLYKGIIKIVVGFVAFICSLLLSYELVPFVATFVQEHTSNNVIATVGTYILSYLVSAIICGIVARMVIGAIKPISGGFIDRVSGFVFGVLRGLLIALTIFSVIAIVTSGSYYDAKNPKELFDGLKPDLYPSWVKNSSSFKPLNSLIKDIMVIAPREFMTSEFRGIPKLPVNTITVGEQINSQEQKKQY